MDMKKMGPDISKSALIIVDMQNDFVHPDGALGHRAREYPERETTCLFSWARSPM
jgi:nicotinamidase-related amidase